MLKTIETVIDKRRLIFDSKRDGWIPHQYEETKQYDSFYGWNENWTVVDVGGWLGIWTVWAAPHVKKVYSLEPEPELCKLLTQNVYLNDLKNVELRQLALSDRTGIAELLVTKFPSASTLIHDAWSYGAEYLYEGSYKIKVKGYTWDDWVKRENLNQVHLLKIDIEGAELHVLDGMSKVLPERIIIATYHLTSPFQKIFNTLFLMDYTLDGFGYYDSRAPNKGKPHSAFFRRKDISFETPIKYVIGKYEWPTRSMMDEGIPFYWESMGVYG